MSSLNFALFFSYKKTKRLSLLKKSGSLLNFLHGHDDNLDREMHGRHQALSYSIEQKEHSSLVYHLVIVYELSDVHWKCLSQSSHFTEEKTVFEHELKADHFRHVQSSYSVQILCLDTLHKQRVLIYHLTSHYATKGRIGNQIGRFSKERV